MQTKTMRLVVACLICATVLCVGGASAWWWTTTFTENDNGSTVVIEQGTIFYLQLLENPAAEYPWEIVTSDGLDIISSEREGDRMGRLLPMGDMIGSMRRHWWTLRANELGDQTIIGRYKQPWGDDTFWYTLNVRVVPE